MTALAIAAPVIAGRRGGVLAERLDEAAFAAFYQLVAPRLWRYLHFAVRDHASADDLTQETFARVLGSRFEPESDEHLTRYLFRTASNLLADRKRRPGPVTEPLDETRQWAAPTVEPGQRLDLERAFDRLQPRDRQLLYLAHVEVLDHRAVAVAMGVTTASVRVLLYRARRRLAALLATPAASTPAPVTERRVP